MGCSLTQSNLEISTPQNAESDTRGRLTRKNVKINGRLRCQIDQIDENVSIIQAEGFNQIDELKITEILKGHFFFYNMMKSQRSAIISKMIPCRICKDQYVFKQGDPAGAFFIIDEGFVDIEINGVKSKILKQGDYFGQLALIYMAPRSASVKAVVDTRFWCITRGRFWQTIQQFSKKNYTIAKSYVSQISIFSFLTENQKDSISFNMLRLKYEDKQTIFKQRDDANSFFIITEGSVQLSQKKQGKINLTILKAGQSFGEESFEDGLTRITNATAKGKTMCLSIGRDVVKDLLGDKISNIISYNIMKSAIEMSPLLSKLGKIQIEKILQLSKIKNYQKGEVIFKEDNEPSFLAICIEGSVENRKPKQIIGQDFILQNTSRITRNIIKKDKGLVGIITYEDLIKATNTLISDLKDFKRASYEKKMVTKKSIQNTSHIRLQNLIYVKKLGQGQFGKVYLVRESQSSDMHYAIKCIKKKQVIRYKMQRMILQQKHNLQGLNFPLILNYVKSFKDSTHIYFLLEYIQGSDLFEILRQIGIVNREIGVFYLSSLILSIEYLHMKNIIYRDLKPQNVMVQNDGYLKLIDLGTAKQLQSTKGFRTFTIIGTPHYMAPQIILGKGYSFSVDIWSLGIMLYEFLCGRLPFAQNLQDTYEIHNAILKGSLKYPFFMTDVKAKKIIEQFLNRLPELRLPRGFASLKAHHYFDDLDWNALYNKKILSPYLPKNSKKNELVSDKGNTFLSFLYSETPKAEPKEKSVIPNWDQEF